MIFLLIMGVAVTAALLVPVMDKIANAVEDWTGSFWLGALAPVAVVAAALQLIYSYL